MKFKALLLSNALAIALFAAPAYADLPKVLQNELAAEVKIYENLYQAHHGQKIFDYVDKNILKNIAQDDQMLYRLIESMTIAMVENSQKLVIKMDVQNAKSDVSKDGIAYALIPYQMTVDEMNFDGNMLAIKSNGKWTFSRFDTNNTKMLQAIKQIYPSLKLKDK